MDCLERNGIIIGYTIYYQPKITKYSSTRLSTRTNEKSLHLTRLIPRTEYAFQVHAENVNGTGPSGNVTFTTMHVDSKPN